MVSRANDSEMEAVLWPNGDVYAAHDSGYLLGSILRSGQSGENPLVVEIDVGELGEPTFPITGEQRGWRVRVLPGQGDEPIFGRTNDVLLRVVRQEG